MKTKPNKGLRYWFWWFMGIIVPLMLLMLTYLYMRDGVTVGNLLWAVVLFYLFLAFGRTVRGTSPGRFPVYENDPERLGFQYQEVEFQSRDRLTISGWFVPPQNETTVVLCHGFGGNRLMLAPFTRLLVKHGFGVLAFDFRAHGRSEGNLSTWGWLETNDLLGALDYLAQRSEVDPARIGVLGFSLGGQVALRTAPGSALISAVAAEGPSPAVLADHLLSNRLSLKKILFLPYFWLIYSYHRLLVGLPTPTGVIASMEQIAPRPLLLITSGEAGEKLFIRHLFTRAQEPKTLYEIPEARHVEGILARPEEYEQKLLTFFSQSLQVVES